MSCVQLPTHPTPTHTHPPTDTQKDPYTKDPMASTTTRRRLRQARGRGFSTYFFLLAGLLLVLLPHMTRAEGEAAAAPAAVAPAADAAAVAPPAEPAPPAQDEAAKKAAEEAAAKKKAEEEAAAKKKAEVSEWVGWVWLIGWVG